MKLQFSSYKILEEEFMRFSEYVAITDENLEVYSIRIIDLMVRIATEFETELRNFYRDLYDSDADEDHPRKRAPINWILEKIADKLYLNQFGIHLTYSDSRLSNSYIQPLLHLSNDNSWWKFYNVCKHNKNSIFESLTEKTNKNFPFKPLQCVIESLAGLYILNMSKLMYDFKDKKLLEVLIASNYKKASGLPKRNLYQYPIEAFQNTFVDFYLESKIFSLSYLLEDDNFTHNFMSHHAISDSYVKDQNLSMIKYVPLKKNDIINNEHFIFTLNPQMNKKNETKLLQ
jgi:hypothetical protein